MTVVTGLLAAMGFKLLANREGLESRVVGFQARHVRRRRRRRVIEQTVQDPNGAAYGVRVFAGGIQEQDSGLGQQPPPVVPGVEGDAFESSAPGAAETVMASEGFIEHGEV